MSPGAPWARVWGHGGSGGVRDAFLDDFEVPRGCRREFFWRHFSVVRRRIFPRNVRYVSGGFFHASGSLLDSFGHRFRYLSVVLGSGRNGTPACTGATFSMFHAVRNTAFSGIAFEGARGDDFFEFSVILGSAGPPGGSTLGTMGRLFGEGILDGFLVSK